MTTACPYCAAQIESNENYCQNCGLFSMAVRTGSGSIIGRVKLPGEPEAAEPLELETDIVAEPVVAFRIWEIDTDKPIVLTPNDIRELSEKWEAGLNPFHLMSAPSLGGVGVSSDWTHPVMEAHCSPPDRNRQHCDESPNAHCDCGIWALKDEEDVSRVISRYRRDAMAWGTVQLWGTIVETELGYRAKYAKPLSINVYGISQREADEIAEAYECDVQLVTELPLAVQEEEEATRAAHAQVMAQQLKQLQSSLATAGASMRAASGQISSITTAASQAQATAQYEAMKKLLELQEKRSQKSWLGRIMSGWFWLGMAIVNFSFLALGFDWVNFIAGMCGLTVAGLEFRHTRLATKLLLAAIPFMVCMVAMIVTIFFAILLDNTVLRWKRKNFSFGYSEGWAEDWLWAHDPTEKIENWITS